MNVSQLSEHNEYVQKEGNKSTICLPEAYFEILVDHFLSNMIIPSTSIETVSH